MRQTRRLAAILAADVAGYSRLMGADEEGTHERLKAQLQELVNPKIGEPTWLPKAFASAPGLVKCGWLKMLYPSTRNCALTRSVTFIVFVNERSKSTNPGP